MKKICKAWKQSDGIEIKEVGFDGDAHAFTVYVDGRKAITIYSVSVEQTEDMRAGLDAGEDVRDWEDGNGVSVGAYITLARFI